MLLRRQESPEACACPGVPTRCRRSHPSRAAWGAQELPLPSATQHSEVRTHSRQYFNAAKFVPCAVVILENAVFLKAEQNRFVFICKWNSALSQSDYRSIFPKADVHQAIGKQVHALWGPPRALRHLQRPGAVPLGYSGTFFSTLATKLPHRCSKRL